MSYNTNGPLSYNYKGSFQVSVTRTNFVCMKYTINRNNEMIIVKGSLPAKLSAREADNFAGT